MGKLVHDDILDAALDFLVDNATFLCVNSAEPSTYAEAYTTYALARVAITSADFAAREAGSTSGRKMTVSAQSSISNIATGIATHVAIVGTDADDTNAVLYGTTCVAQAITSGGVTNVPSWDIELRAPL